MEYNCYIENEGTLDKMTLLVKSIDIEMIVVNGKRLGYNKVYIETVNKSRAFLFGDVELSKLKKEFMEWDKY